MRLKVLSISIVLLLLSSCTVYEDPYGGELLVQVKGLLTGNPREGLPVTIYETEEDARTGRYPIAPVTYTDYFGEVLFVGLQPRREYYVRVEALLNTKVRSTGRIRHGSNISVIRFL